MKAIRARWGPGTQLPAGLDLSETDFILSRLT